MSWFDVYILWNLNSFIGFFIFISFALLCILFGCCYIPYWIFMGESYKYDREDTNNEEHTKWKRKELLYKRGTRYVIPGIIISILLTTIIPTTETMLKIIATKKGIDAIQSDEASKYIGQIDKLASNALTLINETIEKKLEKQKKEKDKK